MERDCSPKNDPVVVGKLDPSAGDQMPMDGSNRPGEGASSPPELMDTKSATSWLGIAS